MSAPSVISETAPEPLVIPSRSVFIGTVVFALVVEFGMIFALRWAV